MPPKGSTRQKKQPEEKAVMGPLAPYYDTEMSVAAKRALAEGTSVPSKRRRMADEVSVSSAGGAYVGNGNVRRGVGMIDYAVQEEPKIKVDFCNFDHQALNEYLTRHDLVPPMYPSPLSSSNPPLPFYLVNPPSIPPRSTSPSPPASITPANRPRRDGRGKDIASRRRSSRLADEDAALRDPRHPIMWDLEDAKRAMAEIAQRHYNMRKLSESDAITEFVYAVRTQGETNRCISQAVTPSLIPPHTTDRSLKILPQ